MNIPEDQPPSKSEFFREIREFLIGCDEFYVTRSSQSSDGLSTDFIDKTFMSLMQELKTYT